MASNLQNNLKFLERAVLATLHRESYEELDREGEREGRRSAERESDQ